MSIQSPLKLVKAYGFKSKVKLPTIESRKSKAAFRILQKEEDRATRSRLEILLIQQFTSRYGSKLTVSSVNDYIKRAVSDFLETYSDLDVAESMLDTLEQTIRENVKGIKKMVKDSMNSTTSDNNSRSNGDVDNNNNLSRSAKTLKNPNQWAVLNAIMALNDEEKEKAERRKVQEKQERFKKALEEQRNELKKKQFDEEENKKKSLRQNKEQFANYGDEQEIKRQKKLEKQAREKALIEYQIDFRRLQREKEREVEIARGQADIVRAKRLIVEDEEKRAKKKEEQKKAQDFVKEENERNKLIVEERKRQEVEYTRRLNKEYEEKLEREEKARAMAFKGRVDALKAIEAAYENQAGAAIATMQKQTELRTNANMEQKLREDEEKERLKQEKRRRDIEKSRAFNLTLIEKKKEEKERLRQADINQRVKFEKDFAVYNQQEKSKADKKKMDMDKIKAQLDAQVEVRHRNNRDKSALSEIEIELNKKIVAKIMDNPSLMERVVERVQPEPASQTSGFQLA